MAQTFSFQLFKSIRNKLADKYPEESDTLAFEVVEHFSGFNRTDILIDKPFTTDLQFQKQIEGIINRLLTNEPLQYILSKAHFYGHWFEVNQSTLIPRQETEELVHLILKDIENKESLSILDIGTGSGCIPITLQLEADTHNFEAVDISEDALKIATENALRLGAEVDFKKLDILTQNLSSSYDIILSNPPYVLDREKTLMQKNVLDYEPSTALFVPDNTPLLFYKRITELAVKHLNPRGKIYFEINEQFGKETIELLNSYSFVELKLHQDLNGKDRIVSGILP